MNRSISCVVVALSVFLGAVAAAPASASKAIPEGLMGFSGQVRGVVVAKEEEEAFSFKVGRLIRTWRDNKASEPRAIVGRTVRVVPRWIKGEGGGWRPYGLSVAFIRLVKVGDEMTLELRHVEGPRNFQILELSGPQREMARGAERRDEPRREGDERDRLFRRALEERRDKGRREGDERREGPPREVRPEGPYVAGERRAEETTEMAILRARIRSLEAQLRALREENEELRRLLLGQAAR